MSCPNCKQEVYCGCDNCKEKNKHKPVEIYVPTGDFVKCPHCGYTAHADVWQDWEFVRIQNQ